MTSLSILIVNWNTRNLLAGCLESIAAHRPSDTFEVIVVDNASPDGSARMVAERFPCVRLIASEENLGYAEGNNRAIEASQGEFLLLLNPDIVVLEDALDRMLAFLRERPDAGAVGCKLIHPGDIVQRSCRGFPTPASIAFEILGLARLFPRHPAVSAYRMAYFDYNIVAEVDQPMASSLMVRREAIEQVGLMDPQFPIYFNDVDWCYRIKGAGWKIYFTPNARMIHYGGQSTRQVRRAMIWQSHLGLYRFYRKHYRRQLLYAVYAAIVAAIFTGGAIRVALRAFQEILAFRQKDK